jgi:hypothetical protein
MQQTGKKSISRGLPNAITASSNSTTTTLNILKFKIAQKTTFLIFQIINPKDYQNSIIAREYCIKNRYAASAQRYVKQMMDSVPEFVQKMIPYNLFEIKPGSTYDFKYPFTVLPASEIACKL